MRQHRTSRRHQPTGRVFQPRTGKPRVSSSILAPLLDCFHFHYRTVVPPCFPPGLAARKTLLPRASRLAVCRASSSSCSLRPTNMFQTAFSRSCLVQYIHPPPMLGPPLCSPRPAPLSRLNIEPLLYSRCGAPSWGVMEVQISRETRRRARLHGRSSASTIRTEGSLPPARLGRSRAAVLSVRVWSGGISRVIRSVMNDGSRQKLKSSCRHGRLGDACLGGDTMECQLSDLPLF